MEPEYLPADRRLRARVLAGALGVLALVALGMPRFTAWLRAFLQQAEVDTVLLLLELAFATSLLGFVLCGVACLRLGRRVLAHACFPPPGLRVLRPTRVVRGAAARRWGYTLVAVAVVFLLGSAACLWYVHQTIWRFSLL
ncbi:MAG: hypothetical protein KatS3mg131_0981 [Candidatus Tectimicrobiota bacterium]|nr:MAG: hypothetical protein KatS3mg131_0981 [Candidatus Tectomicrobia bacterium]